MAHKPHITLLNSTLSVAPQELTFKLFAFLPKELRLQIWEDAVPQERLIHIFLSLPEERQSDPPPRYLEKNHLGKPISGPRYKATADDHKLNSKLLGVNYEARGVALAFYRVHFPVSLRVPGTKQRKETTFYLNPEHDVLHIDAVAPVKETLIDFLWDIKAYDPKDVGLVKMATDLEGFCAHDLQYLKRSDLLLIRQRKALVESLSQLRELWFVYKDTKGSRPPPIGDHELYPVPSSDPCHTNVGFHKDDYMTTIPDPVPISGSVSTFNRVGRDPRQLEETDLSQLSLSSIDAREIIWRWKRLLRTWGIQHQPGQVEYRLLVGQRPASSRKTRPVECGGLAMKPVSAKDEEHNSRAPRVAISRGSEEGTCQEKAVAVGYWLFPVEAVGKVGESQRLADMDFGSHRTFDMRSYWPELLLSSIG